MENSSNKQPAPKPQGKPQKKKPENDKKERLAAALRDNLRRRKAVTMAANEIVVDGKK